MCAGVVARERQYLPYIKEALTSKAVESYFAHLLEENSKIERCVTRVAPSPGLGGVARVGSLRGGGGPRPGLMGLYIMNTCRYELPGIAGLNFVLTHSLGGGGVSSLRIDPQV